jgi:hypothetical protein
VIVQTTPYSFLNKTIRVLVSHPIEKVRLTIKKSLSEYPLYDIIEKLTAKESERVLLEKKVHVCFSDCSSEEISLLKNNKNTFFIAIDLGRSALDGFQFSHEGGWELIPIDYMVPEILQEKARYYGLLNIINPFYENDRRLINRSTRILFQKEPENVTEWAMKLEKTERYLRMIWEHMPVRPKTLHFIYKMYTGAFRFYDTGKLSKDYKVVSEYFFKKKPHILDYINRRV